MNKGYAKLSGVLVLVAGMLVAGRATAGSQAPTNVAPEVWTRIAPQLKAARYAFEAGEAGVFKARNPAHDFEVVADTAGVRVKDSVVLRALAFQGAALPRDVRPAAQGARLEYKRGNVTEWFENGPSGLEQGFTIADSRTRNAECGTRNEAAADLRLLVDVAGARSVTVEADGQKARITDGNGRDFGYGGLKAWDATGRALACHLAPGSSGGASAFSPQPTAFSLQPSASLFIVCDARNAVYPVTIDPVLTSMAKKLTASDGAAYDFFGISVSVAGDVALVGAREDDSSRGSAYVFERNAGGTNAWGQVKRLVASDRAVNDKFGCSVSVAGDVALVGAYADDIGRGSAYLFERNAGGTNAWGQVKKLVAADGTNFNYFGISVGVDGDVALAGAYGNDTGRGAAYVFERNAGGTNAWGQVKKLVAADGANYDCFGISVGVAGDTALVGAYENDSDRGAAYVFERNVGGTNAWGQVKKLTASDGAISDCFGWSVSIAGDVALVGATGDDDLGDASGAAYVFERNADGTNAWGQVRKLVAADGAANDYFGCSVSVAGDVALVGAYCDDTNRGAAYVFARNADGTNAWGQVKKLVASDGAAGDRFGQSVSVGGTVALVGAYGDDSSRGSVRLIPFDYAGWSEKEKLTASDDTANDWLGISVSVWGDVALVGAGGDDSQLGAAYVYERNAGGTNAWGQVKKLLASDGVSGDQFGWSVGVWGDVALVSAIRNDSYRGAAYVFERNAGGTNAWGQVKKLTASDGASSDYFGYSVSAAGDIVLVGAYGNDEVNNNSGAAYVFERNAGGTNAWGQVKKLTASDGAASDYFGIAVSADGDVALVGAYGYASCRGSAYVFERNAGGINAWGQVKKLTAPDGAANDFFGYSVSAGGDVALVGAWGNDDLGLDGGSAYVFERNAGGANMWGQVKKLLATDRAEQDCFGYSVSVYGDVALVGAYGDDDAGSGSGSAYIFERNAGGTNVWGQVRKLLASNGAASDGFGCSVSVHGDAAVAGAWLGDGLIADSGSAYVFEGLLYVAPVAVDDTALTGEDTAVVINVLANDTNANGGAFLITSKTDGANGAVAITGGGTNVTYTPNADWHGSDSFTYTVSDENGMFATGTVNVTVSAVNDPPVAVNDSASTLIGTAVVINVLTNDTDVDGGALSITAKTDGAHGTAAITGGGTNVTYTPAASWHGSDSFTYTVSDGNGGLATGRVNVTVELLGKLDYDGDGVSDLAVYAATGGAWYINYSGGGAIKIFWGFVGSETVPGDYDGDGLSDLSIFDKASGRWYIRTVAGTVLARNFNWGWSGATPVVGDYDGDGKDDLAVMDENTGRWYIYSLAKRQVLAWNVNWGWRGAKPVSGDYNGDGKSDLAVLDPNIGRWYIYSLDDRALAWKFDWGCAGAQYLPGDFDGDGASDLAAYVPNTCKWYIYSLKRKQALAWGVYWGLAGATPVSGDYNGDGITDLALYHQAAGKWYIRTLAGSVLAWAKSWGWSATIPVKP